MSMQFKEEDLQIVHNLLKFIGEDPERESVVETPKRVLKAWKEFSSGYNADVEGIMSRTFDIKTDSNEIVIVKDIPFISMCEHHLLPFHGTVNIGYIPNPEVGVLGLSKFARLVEVYSRRIQVQERLTTQIASDINKYLSPIGVGVVVKAEHSCMSIRGVKCYGSATVTSKMMGVFFDIPQARQELLELFKV